MSDKVQKYIIKDPLANVKDFIAGSMGGVGLVAAGHPFDTIKVKMQTGEGSFSSSVKNTYKTRGPLGFYAGALSPLIGLAAMNSVLFSTFMFTVRIFNKNGDVNELSLPQVALAGGVGGFFCSFVEGPQDLIKCKIQSGLTESKGSVSCFRDILKNHGLRGMLQSHNATVIRNVPANLFYMLTYEFMKRRFGKGDSNKCTSFQAFLSGGIAGISYWAFTYPADVVKTVMQTQHSDPSKRKYKNYLQGCKGVYAEFGFAGLFKGFLPCMLRSFPANAACFFAYEMTKKMIKGMWVKKIPIDE